jgi:hypothetical protein
MGKTFIRSGASLAIGTIIDGHLDKDDCDLLYKNWQGAWGDFLEFKGGIVAITSEMVVAVDPNVFIKTFGPNKNAAKRILNVARTTAGR